MSKRKIVIEKMVSSIETDGNEHDPLSMCENIAINFADGTKLQVRLSWYGDNACYMDGEQDEAQKNRPQ